MQGVNGYTLLDCGGGRRLERFGAAVVSRPAPAAAGSARLGAALWDAAVMHFSRESGWTGTPPPDWQVSFGPARLLLSQAAGGQIGVFPEHAAVCDTLDSLLGHCPENSLRTLNLFAHTGLATLRLAAGGRAAEIVHTDAAGAAVRQARENAAASGLESAPVRWIVDDAITFLRREIRRNSRYDLILADPPSYGRGKKGGEWKLERDLPLLLDAAGSLARTESALLCITCHSEGWDARRLLDAAAAALPAFRHRCALPLRLLPESGADPLPAGTACFLSQTPFGEPQAFPRSR